MGGGSYDYIASSTRSRSYANQSRETVFHNESIYKDMPELVLRSYNSETPEIELGD